MKSVLILWTTFIFFANYCVAMNVAKHKQTTQSTFNADSIRKSAKAVDGDYEQNLVPSTGCSHTDPHDDQRHWWAVDLGAIYAISNVVIFGRTDCCSDRLSNFNIDVIKPCKNSTHWFEGVTSLCHHRQEATTYLNATCSHGTIGRYVRIQLKDPNPLALCEVEVHGLFMQDLNSVTLPYTCGFEGHSYDGLDGTIETAHVNSDIHCAYICAYMNGCHAADFVRKNKSCTLMERKNGSNVVSDPDHNVFLVN
ncbi:fucolectin-3-like [Mytilus californianus]|uniref:fucolectin-3-like n=1 Tax=Mytilus californianus TaxID=6549 RepID=UPI002247B3EA|nr:fucolectin-3-like [Mytilus californianus]